jgi:hypothetical protein
MENTDKWKNLELFCNELTPIIGQLNGLIDKYKIYPLDDVIYLRINQKENRIDPLINYESFPKSLSFSNGESK